MSPWWREQLSVSFGADHVSARRRSRGPRRRELDCATQAVSPPQATHDWRATLQAFGALVEQAGWRNVDLDVVLSSHFVHYLVLPWVENLSAQEVMTYARHQLQALYGADADTWTVCVGRAAAGLPRLAAAVETQLLGALRAQAAVCRSRLTGVQPLLAAACEALPDAGAAPSGWLAVVEPGRMSVSRLERGHCLSVRSAGYAGDAARPLLTLLEQDALCAGVGTAAKLFLRAGSGFDSAPLRDRGWQVLPSDLQGLL